MNPLPFLLEDAATYAASMVQSLRDSHTEAINNGNEFAAVAIFLALTKAVEMEAATAGLRDAAKNSKA